MALKAKRKSFHKGSNIDSQQLYKNLKNQRIKLFLYSQQKNWEPLLSSDD
jgi:hypothetical protein